MKTAVGQTVNITFNYNEKAWREAITGITVNGTPLTEDQYTLIAGYRGTLPPYPEFPSKIKITGAVFTTPGDYKIVVQAGGYVDATVIQNKTPVLIPDVTDNNIGNPIEITFTDNEPWRTAITAVSVDGSDLAADKYTIAAGKITIAAGVFTENRNYTVVIRTEGYCDAAVLQSIIVPVPQTMFPGNIYTIAGNGTAGYSGDGGAAAYAQLNKPGAATVDSYGNIYITDSNNHAIRKIDSNGIITTIAGDGTRGNNKPGSGSPSEGVPATEAPLSIPGNVAFDSAGNLYIADQYCVRKVDANGIITTVTTTDGDCTIAFDNDENLYIVNKSAHKICKMDPSGTITTIAGTGTEGCSGDGSSATDAQLNMPWAVTLDSFGNLYIADCKNNRIRKVDSKGTITTVAGKGTEGYSGDGGPATEAQLNYPLGIALDSTGNLYIADYKNNRIRKVDSEGTITTIAGTGTGGYSGDGGSAIEAQLNRPRGVTLDSADNLYIADYNNHRIRFVKAAAPVTLNPPVLTADSTDNKVGQAIEITLTDNETWRGAITEVKVDDTVLDSSQYTKEAGKITIAASVFTEAKDYTITITATGYSDATVTQTIQAAPADVVFTIDGDAVTTATYTMAELQAMTATEGDYPSKSGTVKCKGVALKDLLTQLSITNGSLIAQINITDADSFTVDPVTVADLLNTDKAYLLTYLMDGAPVTGGETALRIYRAADSPKAATIKNVYGITISNPPVSGAPALTADSTENKVGNPIDITFTNNEAWRNAITEVKVGDTVLESSQYTKEAGKITIATGVFTKAGTYTIVIKANGYEDASVTQIINKDYVTTTLSIKIDNGSPITVTAEQINALNPNNEIRYFSHYKDGQMNYFTGLGAPLAAILSQYASLNSTNIASVTARGADGYYVTFADPQNELFNERYYYPAVGDRVKVDSIIVTKAAENLVNDSSQLDNVFTMRLIMGQTSSEERTISRMVKWVSEIDITTTTSINVPVTGVTLNKTTTTLVVNQSEQLTASVTPANATDQTITWTSDNEAVATVDNTGKVTAVGAGQAIITATTNDGSCTASCTVTAAIKPLYKLTPVEDDVYTIGTSNGSSTMTVKAGQIGLKYFAVSVKPVVSHEGDETVIFTHWRGGTELQLNATVADFDVANTAKAGFNVQSGDVIKVYIVDCLTNDSTINPVVFQ